MTSRSIPVDMNEVNQNSAVSIVDVEDVTASLFLLNSDVNIGVRCVVAVLLKLALRPPSVLCLQYTVVDDYITGTVPSGFYFWSVCVLILHA